LIEDWDDAYANGAYIEAAADYPAKWAQTAARFRQKMTAMQSAELDIVYGESERQRLDIVNARDSIFSARKMILRGL
jgi:hypothetical protein